VKFKEAGKSTLSGRKLWFDNTFGRLNTEEKGIFLGSFQNDDRLLIVYNNGNYEISDTELNQRFDGEKVMLIEKFNPEKVVTAVYLDKEKLQYTIKRFKVETTTLRNKFFFIKEGEGNQLEAVTTDEEPILMMQSGRGQQIRKAKIKVTKVVEVMGWRALGAKLADFTRSTEMEWEKKKGDDKNQPELF